METNPYLLGLTIVVSIVHSIFEFLAFKNGELIDIFMVEYSRSKYCFPSSSSCFVSSPLDIQFWNSRQSLEGLSVRSIIFGVFQSLVVLLYILDNETNFVVQVSVFIGLLIDLWKITKVMDVRVCGKKKLINCKKDEKCFKNLYMCRSYMKIFQKLVKKCPCHTRFKTSNKFKY